MKKEKKHYLIYQTTNLVNGKIYIGKHITTDIEDNYFGSGNLIRAAINKYGLENFVKTILFELQNEEEMNLLEKTVVTQEFCDREDTYNINVGGDGGWSYVNNIGRNIGFRYANLHGLNNRGKKGKPQSEYQRKRCKEAIALDRKLHPEKYDQTGEKNPMFGKHLSVESKKKISEAIKGKNNPMSSRMWIRNPQTKEFKVWLKNEPIPTGWEKGKYQPKKNNFKDS